MKNTLIIIGLALAFVGGYFFSQKYNLKIETKNPVLTVAPSKEPVITENPTSTTISTPSVKVEEDLKEIIKQLLVKIHGQSVNDLTITVSKQEGDYAKGGASAQGGGGMWLAAKHDGKWTLVWEGNGVPDCQYIKSFNFPTDMLINVCD